MPLTLNIGHSRKVGEPNYGSRGASVNLQMELEASVVRDPEELQRKIKYLFGLAKSCVEDELGASPTTGHYNNGSATSNGSHQPTSRHATEKQVRALHAIAARLRLNLPSELRTRYDVNRLDELTVQQASEFIDALKATSANGMP